MPLVATRKELQNHAALDPWTAVHASTGLAFGLMRVPLRWALPVAVLYELVEQVVERREWGQDLFNSDVPESVPNAVVDTLVFLAGHLLGTAWSRQ